MKRFQYGSILPAAACAVLLLAAAGCEYDVAEPKYYDPYTVPPTPSISAIVPARAIAGVNRITIEGLNFSASPDSNRVYFGNTEAEVVSASTTSLVVRRPAILGTVPVKVVSYEAMVVAAAPAEFTVDAVAETYGGFLEGTVIKAIAVDNQENLYAIFANLSVVRVGTDASHTALGSTTRAATDAVMSSDGKIVVFANSTTITKFNPSDGTDVQFVKVNKKISVGDIDANGVLYMSGKTADLFVVQTDGSFAAIGVYAGDDVKDIRVYNGYVYVWAEGKTQTALWRHPIMDAIGTLGGRELVLDKVNAIAPYNTAAFKDMAFSADGQIFIATDNANPVFVLNADGTQDAFYKGILTTGIEKTVWGPGNHVYAIMLISGAGNVHRIDMGEPGAPYYGRW
jgi:hypothetical protein